MTTALFPDLVVNGETVPHALVASEVQNHNAPAGKPGIAWRKAARAMAIRTLLLQEARRTGVAADPLKLGPGRFESEGEAAIRGLLDDVLAIDKPSPDAVRAEWSRDPSRFRAPPLWEVSHILVACDADNLAPAAQKRAEELCIRATDDPAEFARLAAEHSNCGSKTSGGFLGQIGPGDTVPEFEAVLRALSEGETTAEPVRTRFGYHIIRLDALAEGAELPFDAVRKRIETAMEKAAWAQAAQDYIACLVAKAEISGVDLAQSGATNEKATPHSNFRMPAE